MSPNPATPAVVAERYEIVSTIAEGTTSVVYEARMRPMLRRVAVKVLRAGAGARPDVVERFLRAGTLLGELDHPHLVSCVDVGTVAGAAFLAMEMLDGETLAARIQRGPPMPLHEALAWWFPIASAVVALHERGVVHGDLKPASVVLARQATVHTAPKLLALGEASVGGRPDATNAATARYLAPELASATASVNARSDQWSLAAMLRESLLGHPSDVRTPIVDRRLEPALRRALDDDPSRRFAGVGAFARALIPLVEGAVRERWIAVFGAPIEEAPRASLPPSIEAPRSSSAGPAAEVALAQTVLSVDATMVARDSGPSRPPSPSSLAPPVVRPHGRPSRGRRLIAAAVVMALLGMGVAAALSGGSEPPSESSSPASRTTYPVALRTEPVSARIDLDGEYVSAGVLLREFPRDGRSHTLRVYAPGYEPQLLTFANVGPGELVTLTPLAARAPPGGSAAQVVRP